MCDCVIDNSECRHVKLQFLYLCNGLDTKTAQGSNGKTGKTKMVGGKSLGKEKLNVHTGTLVLELGKDSDFLARGFLFD